MKYVKEGDKMIVTDRSVLAGWELGEEEIEPIIEDAGKI